MSITAVSADGVTHSFEDGTDTAVIGRVMKDYATANPMPSQPTNTLWGDVKGGVSDAMTGIGQGVQTLGGVMSRHSMPEWGGAVSGAGDAIVNAAPTPPPGPSPASQIGSDLSAGQYGAALSALPHAAVRGLIGSAPILAGGAVGGPIGAGLAGAATAYGPTAYARAANNGRSAPSDADALTAVPGAVAQGAGAALLGGASSAASMPARVAARVGLDAAGMGGMNAAGQVADTAGTDKGLAVDPYQVVGAAATGGAMGAARMAPGVAKAGIQAGSDQLMARTLDPPSSPEAAQSVQRVNAAMDDAKASAPNTRGQPFTDLDAANMVKSNLTQRILGDLADLQGAGLIDRSDVTQLRSQVINESLRHNNNATPALFDAINNLPNVPEGVRSMLAANVMDLNTVSTESFQNRMVGPLGRVGNAVGQTIGIGTGLAGAIPTHGASLLLALAHNKAGAIGQAIGNAGDRLIGTNTPQIKLQGINAAKMLGTDSTPPTPSLFAAMQAARTDPDTGQAPDPVPVNTPIPTSPTLAKAQAASALPNLPALRVDTAGDVAHALASADSQMAAQPSQAPAAVGLPPQPPLPSSTPPGLFQGGVWTPGHSMVANRNALTTADMIHGASGQAEAAGRIPPGTTAALQAGTHGMMAPAVAEVIQSYLPNASAPGTPTGPVRDPVRYTATVNATTAHVIDTVKALRDAGQHAAANALQDIAVNHHTIAAKQAARAALPPQVAALIPDWAVNYGGK